MTTLTFNPLEFSRKLQAAGMPEHQADLIANSQKDLLDELAESRTLATKADVARLETRMMEIKAELIKWIAASFLVIVALMLAGFGIVITLLKP